MNEKTKQQYWKLARVKDLLPGQDGVVRAARVRVAYSEGKHNVLRRSIEQLIPLEVTEILEETDGEADEAEDKESEQETKELNKNEHSPPRRETARASETRRKELVKRKLL
jgi:spore germination cell wall hydrolase CwlJ-like protein